VFTGDRSEYGEVDVGRKLETADRFVDAAATEDVVEGEGTIVFVGIRRLALFRVDGEVLCVDNRCPHAGGFLGLGAVEGCMVRCPRHDWRFDLKTGQCESDPRYDVRRFAVREEEGRVWVGVPEAFE
jgi:nitrite reductase (NADH) small subunit